MNYGKLSNALFKHTVMFLKVYFEHLAFRFLFIHINVSNYITIEII